jgi:hypothetical protein
MFIYQLVVISVKPLFREYNQHERTKSSREVQTNPLDIPEIPTPSLTEDTTTSEDSPNNHKDVIEKE